MRYAEAGYNLEIDLARGNIEKVKTDPALTETLLGGLGTCIKILWDRTTPETKPFDPENPLIFSNGLLVGTPAFSANRTLVATISPVTNLLGYPMGEVSSGRSSSMPGMISLSSAISPPNGYISGYTMIRWKSGMHSIYWAQVP